MIIQCKKIKKNGMSEFVSEKKNYIVLGVYYREDGEMYRIVGDNPGGHPFLVSLREIDFEVVSGLIPKTWIFQRGNKKEGFELYGRLNPERFMDLDLWEEGFWGDWSAGNLDACKCFEEEISYIRDTEVEFFKKNKLALTDEGGIVKGYQVEDLDIHSLLESKVNKYEYFPEKKNLRFDFDYLNLNGGYKLSYCTIRINGWQKSLIEFTKNGKQADFKEISISLDDEAFECSILTFEKNEDKVRLTGYLDDYLFSMEFIKSSVFISGFERE